MRYSPGFKEGSLTRILLAFSLFSVFTLLLITSLMTGQLYASTLLCDRFDNASDCEPTTGPSGLSSSPLSSSSPSTNTGSTSKSVTEDVGTPLMLPDISPTEEDLGNTVSNDNPATTSSGDSDGDNSNNNVEDEKSDSPVQDSDNEESDTVDSDNGGDDSSDGPSLIPFP